MDEKLNLFTHAGITGDHLFELIQLLPHSAHIKEIQTGQYLASNKINSQIYGIENEADIIGLVVDDIEIPEYVKAVHHLDAKVKTENNQIRDPKRVIVNRNGILRLQTMLKIPISGHNHKQPQCILTLCYDNINQLRPTELFFLYLKTQSQTTLAIRSFLKHIKIHDYFKYEQLSDYPSPREILVLLKIAEVGVYKRVAQSLNLSLKTIEYHIAHLKNKIYNSNIDHLLSELYNRNWIPSLIYDNESFLEIISNCKKIRTPK